MMQINIKRCLSLILAMVLTFSLLPVSALAEEAAETVAIETTSLAEATETPTEAPEETTAPAVVVEETAPVVAAASSNKDTVQAAMDAIVSKYLNLTKVMTAEDITQAVADMDEDTWFEALIEVEDLENSDAVQALTEEELLDLTEKNALFCAFAEAVYERAAPTDDATTYATTVTVLDGKISLTDTATRMSESAGTVTITAKGSLFGKGENTVTITNNSGSTGVLSFDYSAKSYNNFTINKSSASASGTYTATIANGGTVTLYLQSNSGLSNTATLTLKNFSFTEAAASSKVTITFESTLGSVTVGGDAVSSGDEKDVASSGAAFVATAKSGATFLGWIDGDSRRISKEENYTLTPAGNMTVEAAFSSSSTDAWFLVVHNATDYLFDDLSEAVTFASTRSKVVILAANGTLSSGDYTISSGVTLLIPFNSNNTLYTTEPGTVTYNRDPEKGPTGFTLVAPYVYRTLTMADGAKITVNGAISVSAKHCATQTSNGVTAEAYSLIKMQSNSSITIKNGGTLYAWGYITGSGSVVAESGASVYENFQLRDWRGGNATSSIDGKKADYRVFPFSQYYVQNIEVPLTLYAGAKEYARTSFEVTLVGIQSTTVPFIGTSGTMFILEDGYVVKDYMENTGRIKVSVYGNVKISPMTINITIGLLQAVNLNTADYILPLSGHMTVDIQSGTLNLAQDLALLPGCEIYLREDTNFVLGSGNSLYVYDWDNWGKYCYVSNYKYMALEYVPGGNGTTGREKDAMIQVDGTADLSAGFVYTTTNGANICSTDHGVVKLVPGTETKAYQVTQSGNTISAWNEITLTPANLKNSDGSYTKTAEGGAGTYEYINGKWYPPLNILFANIAVNDGLDMYFYVLADAPHPGVAYEAKVTKAYSGKDPVTDTFTYSVDNTSDGWEAYPNKENPTYLRFKCDRIAAKEMTDEVTAKIVIAGTDTVVSNTVAMSVQDYAMSALADSTNSKLDTALVDMLTYGADAQTYFGYNTTELATSTLNDAQKAMGTSEDVDCGKNLSGSDNLKAVSVSAKNKLMLTYYFDFGGVDPTTAGYNIDVSYTDHYGKDGKYSEAVFYDPPNSSYYGVDVKGIAMTNGRSPVTCTVTDNAGNVVGNGTFSVEGYAFLNDGDVYQSLMNFVDSACAYFESLNPAT